MTIVDIFTTILWILLSPILIVCFLLFIIIWLLFTISGLGPVLQYIYKRKDDELLDRRTLLAKDSDMRLISIPGNVNSASGGRPYSVFARYTEPPNYDERLPPVCLPNGLGATLVLISNWHEGLAANGYRVLSFDRLGVGFSDDNVSGKSPTATDLIREMDYVMNNFQPSDAKWILAGGSMGSIVAQCYISAFPSKVVGFLNMDGLPYPFILFKKQFLQAAFIYKVYTYIIWTGIFRPFIGMALKSMEKGVTSKAFSADVTKAQLNQTRFFGNIALEMVTMMDLAEYGSGAWGCFNVAQLDEQIQDALIRAAPNESVTVDEKTSERSLTMLRSPSERGEDWVSEQVVAQAVEKMKMLGSKSGGFFSSVVDDTSSPVRKVSGTTALLEGGEDRPDSGTIQCRPNLPQVWPNLVVRVMSGRNHDFGSSMINKFYTDGMKEMAAAEHSQHVLFAKNGFRTAYPKCNHNKMFFMTQEFLDKIKQISDVLLEESENAAI